MIVVSFYVHCVHFYTFKFCTIINKIGNEIIKKYMINMFVIKSLWCDIYNNMSKLYEKLIREIQKLIVLISIIIES